MFALVLLWLRRAQAPTITGPWNWWGVVFLLAGAVLRVTGVWFYSDWLDAISLLPCLLGVAMLFGGQPALQWAWPAVTFLVFMIPLPYRVEKALAQPLQHLAAVASTYVMQTIGLRAIGEGNTILLSQGPVGVEEACSGLSMLLIFVALATAVTVVVRRPWLDRLLIILSAIPIALLVNVARIAATGIAQEFFGRDAAHQFFHDWAGWMMMPVALLLLWLELWVLGRLLVEAPARAPVAVSYPAPVAAPAAPPKAANNRRKKRAQILPYTPKSS
jgi:exosortase